MPADCSGTITLANLCVAPSSNKQESFRSVQQRYGDGYTSRRQDGINPVICIWNVSTPPMTLENAAAFEAELVANGVGFFPWTPPGESTPSNWIVDPATWQISYPSPKHAVFSFTLRKWYGS